MLKIANNSRFIKRKKTAVSRKAGIAYEKLDLKLNLQILISKFEIFSWFSVNSEEDMNHDGIDDELLDAHQIKQEKIKGKNSAPKQK
jgi:hypothetical protein